ncbi:MAG: helix-turn-helix domain-containing protein [Aliidongia sp.]
MTASAEMSDTLCPIARSQAVIGDRWAVLIVRELFMGNRRFDSLLAQSQATPQMLSSRLKRLEADGMIERKRYMEKPTRYEYELTAMGRAFYPRHTGAARMGRDVVQVTGRGDRGAL